jgi:asparagine synthase (glutamine-hydrolysing)
MLQSMCGVSGFLTVDRHRSTETMHRDATAMSLSLAHRGPDDTGVWVDAPAGVALGHRRLSIQDLSQAGHQPMESESGRYVLSYNGELYNAPQLRAELESQGEIFRGTSDTEILLRYIGLNGLEASLLRADAMFALALWDRVDRQLYLARDRFGEKPLYFGWQKNSLLFGSELRSLMAHPDCHRKLNQDSAAEMLARGYVPGPHSIFEGIEMVRPGTIVNVRGSSPRIAFSTPYWALQDIAGQKNGQFTRDSPALLEELDSVLVHAVRSRLIADVPVGAFLSGGVDSSTVVACMQAHSSSQVRTFSVGFTEEDYDESKYSRAVASHLGTNHTELRVTPADAMQVIPQLAAIYDEPFGDPSAIPTLLVSRLAKQHVKVALSGDGGDELFGGYSRYARHERAWARLSWVPTPVRSASTGMLFAHDMAMLRGMASFGGTILPQTIRRDFLARLETAVSCAGAGSSDEAYLAFVRQWKRASPVMAPSSHGPVQGQSPPERLKSPIERAMFTDTLDYLPSDILVKVDRASMSSGLEARVPFLDPAIAELAWRLSPAVKTGGGVSKWPLRAVLARYLPSELIDRPKKGFGVPVGEWIRGPLHDWAADLLSKESLEDGGVLDPAAVHRRWNEHARGQHDWQHALWNALMFTAWVREYRPTI